VLGYTNSEEHFTPCCDSGLLTNRKQIYGRGEKPMNIPPITSIDNAISIYYNHSELGNREIAALFGRRSSTTISRLKRQAKCEMDKRDVPSFGMNKVNTAVAFEVWGLDVRDLEERRKKIKELNL